MRHGKIVGRVAVMLVGLTSGMPVRAVAPPVPEGACANGAESFAWVNRESWLENWQRLDQQRQQDRKALSTAFRTNSVAATFSCDRERELTIKVRIEEGSLKRVDNALIRRILQMGMVIPPGHAVRRNKCEHLRYVHMGGYWGFLTQEPRPEEAFDAVVETLERKLLELHEEGLFEVTFDSQGKDRADVSIRYEPVDPPAPPQVFNFGGFSR